MKDHYDPWYVRLPDGRVIKAKSTQSVRYHVEAGHIPKNSTLRRLKNEEWTQLDWLNEFADLAGGNARPSLTDTNTEVVRALTGKADPMVLETVGFRGLFEELCTALDSAIHRDKLFLGGIICGLAILGWGGVHQFLGQTVSPKYLPYLAWLIGLMFMALGITWLSRQTHWELSRMRAVPLSEARRGSFGSWINLSITLAVVYAVAAVVLFFAQNIFTLIAVEPASTAGAILQLAVIIVKIAVFQLIFLMPLLLPIGPVEEDNFLSSLRMWMRLCHHQVGRILVYEGFALILGLITAIPTLLPFYWATGHGLVIDTGAVLTSKAIIPALGTEFLFGLAIGPMFVFVTVANVILYLNLRYEFSTNR